MAVVGGYSLAVPLALNVYYVQLICHYDYICHSKKWPFSFIVYILVSKSHLVKMILHVHGLWCFIPA